MVGESEADGPPTVRSCSPHESIVRTTLLHFTRMCSWDGLSAQLLGNNALVGKDRKRNGVLVCGEAEQLQRDQFLLDRLSLRTSY